MSSATNISTLPKLSREALAGLILSEPLTPLTSAKTAVIDVRDSDHIGGHIHGSVHAPTPTLDYKIPELVRQLRDKDTIVFHCALSQQRGPSAALRYLREKERLDGIEEARDKKKQKVYVLEGGFVEWQEKYGKDAKLTEAYDEEVWKYGY